MSDLLELAARCEAAMGADRELDERIGMAVGLKNTMRVGHECLGTDRVVPVRCPAYTASLDAAMTLVGDDFWRVEDHELAGPCALVGDQEGYAATPALALTAAALRARNSLPTAAPAGSSSSPAPLHSLGTGAAEATGESR